MLRAARLCVAILITAAWLVAPSAMAARPKVIEAVPDNGDISVDPALKEIRITFDQEMASGRSVVGGGESFPEIIDLGWEDGRTFVMSVKLRPRHEYWFSINNDRFRNFTNRAGEPAESYPIRFRTAAGSSTAGSEAIDSNRSSPDVAEANLIAFELLRVAIRDHYSYRDRLAIDWDGHLRKNMVPLIEAPTPEDFARIAGTLLARAEDKHISLRVGDQWIGSFMRPSVPNANYELLPRLVPEWREYGKRVATGHWDDGIAYLFIGTWSRSPEIEQSIRDAYEAVSDAKALVIDVRFNGGGAEPLAQELAGCFVAARQLYGKHVTRDPTRADGFTKPRERWLRPNRNQPRFDGPVAVLTGPTVMSSCESFLLMMKTSPRATLIGSRSQGSSGNPQGHDLRNGVTLFLPSWKDMTVDGRELEGVGIEPDIVVESRAQDFRSADPVLNAALEHLRAENDSEQESR